MSAMVSTSCANPGVLTLQAVRPSCAALSLCTRALPAPKQAKPCADAGNTSALVPWPPTSGATATSASAKSKALTSCARRKGKSDENAATRCTPWSAKQPRANSTASFKLSDRSMILERGAAIPAALCATMINGAPGCASPIARTTLASIASISLSTASPGIEARSRDFPKPSPRNGITTPTDMPSQSHRGRSRVKPSLAVGAALQQRGARPDRSVWVGPGQAHAGFPAPAGRVSCASKAGGLRR